MSGTIIMAILGFASTMILTRILSTRVYAMYGLLNTFSTAVIMFISFGYDSSYMRFYYSHGYSQKKFMIMSLKIPIIIFLAFSLLVNFSFSRFKKTFVCSGFYNEKQGDKICNGKHTAKYSYYSPF